MVLKFRRMLRGMTLGILLAQSSAISTASAEAAPQATLGIIVPLTGPLADFGIAIRNGVELAREESAETRAAFSPVYEDSRYESKEALSAFQKLRSTGVRAVYLFGGPMNDTVAPLAEKAKLPTFSTEYDTRYTKGRKYIIRFANNASDYAETLLGELRRRSMKSFAIVKVENQYHNTLSDAFLGALRPGETGEVLFNFQPGEQDFRAAFPKLRAQRADMLGLYLIPGTQHSFLKQYLTAGMPKVAMFGTDSFESQSENAGVEGLVEGALFANSFVSDEFRDRYRKRFGNNVQLAHAALAYEFAKLTGQLFHETGLPAEPDELVARYRLKVGVGSVCGKYYFRDTEATGQYFSFPIAVREVRSGEASIISVREAP